MSTCTHGTCIRYYQRTTGMKFVGAGVECLESPYTARVPSIDGVNQRFEPVQHCLAHEGETLLTMPAPNSDDL